MQRHLKAHFEIFVNRDLKAENLRGKIKVTSWFNTEYGCLKFGISIQMHPFVSF